MSVLRKLTTFFFCIIASTLAARRPPRMQGTAGQQILASSSVLDQEANMSDEGQEPFRGCKPAGEVFNALFETFKVVPHQVYDEVGMTREIFGTASLGWFKGCPKDVVELKVAKKNEGSDFERLVTEKLIMAQLVKGFGHEYEYFCMYSFREHQTGLATWFFEKRPSVAERARIFHEVLKGLLNLHRHGVVHRSVGVPNIYIGYDKAGLPHAKLGNLASACCLEFEKCESWDKRRDLPDCGVPTPLTIHRRPSYDREYYSAEVNRPEDDLYAMQYVLDELVLVPDQEDNREMSRYGQLRGHFQWIAADRPPYGSDKTLYNTRRSLEKTATWIKEDKRRLGKQIAAVIPNWEKEDILGDSDDEKNVEKKLISQGKLPEPLDKECGAPWDVRYSKWTETTTTTTRTNQCDAASTYKGVFETTKLVQTVRGEHNISDVHLGVFTGCPKRQVMVKAAPHTANFEYEAFLGEKLKLNASEGGVVRGLGHSYATGCMFIFTETDDGGNLREWVSSEPSKLERARIFYEALIGLRSLHRLGFVHRNLRSEHILLMKGNDDMLHPKIGAFGSTCCHESYECSTIGQRRYAHRSPSCERLDGGIFTKYFPEDDVESMSAVFKELVPSYEKYGFEDRLVINMENAGSNLGQRTNWKPKMQGSKAVEEAIDRVLAWARWGLGSKLQVPKDVWKEPEPLTKECDLPWGNRPITTTTSITTTTGGSLKSAPSSSWYFFIVLTVFTIMGGGDAFGHR